VRGAAAAGLGSCTVSERAASTGSSAAALAELGHTVVAVDTSLRAIESARERAKARLRGSVQAIRADFYTFEPGGKFDFVCYFDGFGNRRGRRPTASPAPDLRSSRSMRPPIGPRSPGRRCASAT